MMNIENSSKEIKQRQERMQHYFQTHWKLFLAEGVLLIILGVIAIMAPEGVRNFV